MLLHCSSPHICRWVARPPGCPSDTAHRHTSCTLLAKARAQLAHTCCSGRNTSPKRYYAPVPCLFSLSTVPVSTLYYLSSIGFSLATLLCSDQYHLQSIKSYTLSFFLTMCSSQSPLLVFSFIWSSLSLPLALLHALFCLWGSLGSDS